MDYDGIEQKLNSLYWRDKDKYQAYVDYLKATSYKILRNSKGEHKVRNDGFMNLFNDIFGGDFQ